MVLDSLMKSRNSNTKTATGPVEKTNQALAAVILAALCITLPFLAKAFHLDDTFFVRLAQEKLTNPLAIGLADHGYEGNFFTLYLDTHPPLLTSYISLLIRSCGGASEVGLHLGFIIFPITAGISMFFLGRRFTDSPLLSALLLIATPGFMVMSQSVMTDTPALALWLAAIAAYVYGVDRDNSRLLITSGIFTSLAILTTYQSFSLLPLLFIYALLPRRITIKNMLPLIAGLTVFTGIIICYFAATGGPPKVSYSIGVNFAPAFIANKVLASVSAIGGATVFPLIIAVGMLKGKKDYLAFGAMYAALLVLFLSKAQSGQYSFAAAVLQAIFYSAGLLVIYRFASLALDATVAKKKMASDLDNLFLVLWAAGVLVYTVLLLPYSSTRYLLMLFPPIVLIFVKYAQEVIPREDGAGKKYSEEEIKKFSKSKSVKWKVFSIAAVICTALAGFAISFADYQLAEVYRTFAEDYAQKLESSGSQIWFAGEFGLRYYLEDNGGRYLTKNDNTPVAGDHVILSHQLIAHFISDELDKRLQLEQKADYTSTWPVRVEDTGSQAGFYDQFHGVLPWSISGDNLDSIWIYVVK